MASLHSDRGWLLIAFRFNGKLIRVYPGMRDTSENRESSVIKQLRSLIRTRRWGDLRTLFPRYKEIPWFNDVSNAIRRDEQRLEERSVYFIQAETGEIKIGSSTDVERRLNDLQIGSPVKLTVLKIISGSYQLERLLHAKFGHLMEHSEWFRPDAELLSYVKSLNENVQMRLR